METHCFSSRIDGELEMHGEVTVLSTSQTDLLQAEAMNKIYGTLEH